MQNSKVSISLQIVAALVIGSSAVLMSVPQNVIAQEILPADNGLATYHTAPRYRESESHPLRVLAYVVHPIGWVLREAIFRPLSYFASSTEVTRSVMGYREPYDYRQPECFSADDSIPDCRSITPYNYDSVSSVASEPAAAEPAAVSGEVREVYFPNVNFDFNVRKLSTLGKGKARQIAEMLQKDPGVKIVLQGNADNVGSEEYNLKLGMDRAESVREALIADGVAPERLSTVTFGESQPLFKEDTDWARAMNRRVEAHPNDQAAPEAAPAE